MALQNAHSGYEYQDIFTALRLVDVLLSRTTEVVVDVKLFDGDLFDDLTTLWSDGSCTREQLKHSGDPGPLETKILTSKARDCRLDTLVASAVKDSIKHNSSRSSYEYRLIMSDLVPTEEALLAVLRHDASLTSSQAGFSTKCYRLDIDKLWPKADAKNGPATGSWRRVIIEALRAGLKRIDFEWFAEHFVIELEAPKASFDLTKPEALEKLLISRITREIGTGVYPNADLSPTDVAAALVAAARAARAGTDNTSRKTLLRRTRLRDDFGSVARAFPVESAKEIELQDAAEALVTKTKQALGSRVPLLIYGPPGQGKTWACDKLSRDLQKDGWLVANHYCYLNLAEDESRDKRVRLDAVIGSLLAQVAEQEPLCIDELKPRYAANSENLITALQKVRAMYLHKQIALIVDGLDHVTRVLGSTTGKPDPATELAHELSLLDVPDGVVLIVACQGGVHDEPLQKAGASTYELPSWSKDSIRQLGECLGVIGHAANGNSDAIGTTPIISADDSQLDDLLGELTTKSKGNALYATYCYRELRHAYDITPQSTHDLIQALQSLPPFDGTMKTYYEHLLKGIPSEALLAADSLAMLEFAVTRDELKTIYPLIAPYIDSMIDRLMPVLVERKMQGGIRVYHESFQRFLLETHLTDIEHRKSVLTPVIEWLQAKGFFKDIRAIRFLPTLFAEVDRHQEVCNLVDSTYVANAIAACHGEAAIVRNIAVAAESAVHLQDWPTLVRYTELAKEINSYAFGLMEDVLGEFSDIPIALYGANWLAERLLFEGRPVFPARVGLQLCEEVDKAGGVPPWKEYLTDFTQVRESDNTIYGAERDRAVLLAEVRGIFRSRRGIDAAALAAWLDQDGLPSSGILVRMILDIYRSGSLLLQVIRLLPKQRRAAYIMALVQQLPKLAKEQRLPSKNALLKRALKLGLSPWEKVTALEMGVSPNLFSVDEDDLILQTKAVLDRSVQWSEPTVIKWVAGVFIAARTNPTILRRVALLIQGKGWYRCWLEYVVEIARFKANPTGSFLPAFKLLTNETNPFVGKPRACDLYGIRSVINVTLRLGLKHISDEEWPSVLAIMQEVSNNTTTSLQGSLNGPLSTEPLLKLVANFTTPYRQQATISFMEGFFKDAIASRTYYDAIARYHLLRARLSVAVGDIPNAEEYWRKAAHLNACYGQRKDVTIFELLDSLPELIDYDIIEARKRLVRLQPLVRRTLRHTDLKETRHALPTWWSLVADADGIGVSNLIALQMFDTPNRPAGQLQDAQFKLHIAQGQKISPSVRFASRLSLGYQYKSGSDDADLLKLLKATALGNLPIELAADSITSMVQDRITDDRDDEIDMEGIKKLASTTLELNGHELILENSNRTTSTEDFTRPRNVQSQINSHIAINWGNTPIEIARAIRRWSQQSYDIDISKDTQESTQNAAVEALGWRLLILSKEGNEETAENLLRFLAEHLSYRNPERIMTALAQGFEHHNLKRLAVIAHVFAYTKSRGGGGWRTFGGKEQEESLRAAVTIDATQAFQELGAAIVDVLNGKYYAAQGISQALVQAACRDSIRTGMSVSPFDLWDAAADIIEDRLPSLGDADNDDDPYVPTSAADDTVLNLESAIAAVIISGVCHPERPLKRGSLLGTAWLIKLTPATTIKGFQLALTSNLDPAGKTWLLWLILQFESDPYAISKGCQEELKELTQSPFLTVRSLATQILARSGIASPPPPATEVKSLGVDTTPLNTDEQKKSHALAIEELERCAGERLASAEDYMPQLRSVISEKLARQFHSKEFQHSFSSQIEGLTHPASQRMPDAYTLEQETVECTLQEVVAGARVSLARNNGIVGKPEEFESELAAMIIDNPELPLRVAVSRIPRPKFYDVLESESIAVPLPTVTQGPYKDWRVLGMYEARVTPSDRYKKIDRKMAFVDGGAEICDLSSAHNHPSVLGYGIGLLWLTSKTQTPPPTVIKVLKGPLTGIETGTLPLYFGLGIAPQMLLVPNITLVRDLKLKAGPILEGLTLVDEKEQKAIVARTWRTNFQTGEDFGPAYPLIEGMDILIRPDLLESLEKKYSPSIICFCAKQTES